MPVILYIFPHPDDESFGPAPVLAKQRREGHDVFLLTLTKGEATSQRKVHGYAKDKMGAVRYQEMLEVAEALDLSGMTVLDYPDGQLASLDPLELEAAIRSHINKVQPDVLVTYAVHGISGHPDHLVTHAVVKRVFCEMRKQGEGPARLAFFTLSEEGQAGRPEHLKASPKEAIDAVVRFNDEDLGRAKKALQCYVTYSAVIEKHRPLDQVRDGVCFEIFQEVFDPPLSSLFDFRNSPAGDPSTTPSGLRSG